MAAETKKLCSLYDETVAQMFMAVNRLRMLGDEAQDIEDAFERAGRLDDLRDAVSITPGKTARGAELWRSSTFAMFPRAADHAHEYHRLEEYPAADR